MTRQGHTVFTAPRMGKPASCTIVLHANLNKCVSDVVWDSHLCTPCLKFKLNDYTWHFYASWAPHSGKDKENDNSLSLHLNSSLPNASRFAAKEKQIFVVGVDANAELGKYAKCTNAGANGYGCRSPRGHKLLEALHRYGLYAANTHFDQPPQNVWTHFRSRTLKDEAKTVKCYYRQIDYVCISLQHKYLLKNAKAIQIKGKASDHKPVKCVLALKAVHPLTRLLGQPPSKREGATSCKPSRYVWPKMFNDQLLQDTSWTLEGFQDQLTHAMISAARHTDSKRAVQVTEIKNQIKRLCALRKAAATHLDKAALTKQIWKNKSYRPALTLLTLCNRP